MENIVKEGKWLSKIKDIFNKKPEQTYTVELVCYPPFKKDPTIQKIEDVTSLDDPKIEKAYKFMRWQHPKTPIRLYSPLGNKTFYENTSAEYQIKVYDKETNRVDTFNAGTLPQAMSMCEKMWNSNPDSYKNIEVIHNNEVVTNYNGLEEGFTMNLNAAPKPDEEKNNNENDENQQNEVPQVDPDMSTTIKDDQGNDVTISITPDSKKISIDGQNIVKDELDKAINDVIDKAKNNVNKQNEEQNQQDQDQQKEPEQDQDQNDNEEEQPVEDEENPENTEEKDQKQDQNTKEQPQDQQQDNTTDEKQDQEQTDVTSEQRINNFNKAISRMSNGDDSKNNTDSETDDLMDQYDVYNDDDAELDNMRTNLGSKGKSAVKAGLDAFDKDAKRKKELERKSYKDNGGKSFLNKMMNNPVTKELAANALAGLTGGAIAPVFGHHITDHVYDRVNAYNQETDRINKAKKDLNRQEKQDKDRKNLEKKLTKKYSSAVGFTRQDDIEKQAKARAAQAVATKKAKNTIDKNNIQSKTQQFNQKAKETIKNAINKNKKHESLTETELQHSWVDQDKDICNIDEFITLAKNGIHPALADTRRPKWHNTLTDNQTDKYIEVDDQPLEVYVALDGIEEIKHPKTGEPTQVAVIKEKVPMSINQETGGVVYKDGKRYKITFNQFKKLINSPENHEILQKFLKSHPDDPELIVSLYTQAKNNMDEMYSEWEKNYWNEYNLADYDQIERGKIYLRWKEVLKNTAYQDGHEMTADEVNREFGIPKIQKNLKQLGSFGAKLDQQAIDNLIKQLPSNKVDELLNKLETTLEDGYGLNINDLEKRVSEFMLDTPVLFACENLINKMTNNLLQKIEKNISNDKKDKFEKAKNDLLNKYIKKANIHGLIRYIVDPKITSSKIEIQQALDDLTKQFDISKWSMDVNEIKNQKDTKNKSNANWENNINTNVFYNKSDEENKIGILDRIDRSLSRYKNKDTKGIPLSTKYRELFDNFIDQLKKDYPEGNEKELGDVIKSWYKETLRPDIAKDTSVDKQLKNYMVGD